MRELTSRSHLIRTFALRTLLGQGYCPMEYPEAVLRGTAPLFRATALTEGPWSRITDFASHKKDDNTFVAGHGHYPTNPSSEPGSVGAVFLTPLILETNFYMDQHCSGIIHMVRPCLYMRANHAFTGDYRARHIISPLVDRKDIMAIAHIRNGTCHDVHVNPTHQEELSQLLGNEDEIRTMIDRGGSHRLNLLTRVPYEAPSTVFAAPIDLRRTLREHENAIKDLQETHRLAVHRDNDEAKATEAITKMADYHEQQLTLIDTALDNTRRKGVEWIHGMDRTL